MINPIARTKRFVERHKVALAYSAGAAVGVASTTIVYLKYPGPRSIIIPLDETPEQIFDLMKRSGGFDIHNPKTRQVIQIVTKDALDKL